jgi:YVTN family beta-propeller protein
VYRPRRRLVPIAAMPIAVVVTVLSVSNSFAKTISVGRNPGAVAISPDGKTLYVANRDDHTISILSTGSAESIGRVEVGGAPGTIAVSPDGRTAYVALAIDMRGGVAIVDTASRRVTKVSTQCPVRDLAMIPNGEKLYLAEENCGLQVLRLADRSTVTIDRRECPQVGLCELPV